MRAKQPRQPPRRRFLQHERPGERAVVQCLACDRDQARVVLGYAPDGGRAAAGDPPHKQSGNAVRALQRASPARSMGVPYFGL